MDVEPARDPERKLSALIEDLRAESAALKDCYTRYTFQALAVSTAILALVVDSSKNDSLISLLAACGVVILVTWVSRIGMHKYAGVNRHYGYELHLDRTSDIPLPLYGRWEARYRYVGWEEAMQAWRVVQATLFGEVYHNWRSVPYKRKDRFRLNTRKWRSVGAYSWTGGEVNNSGVPVSRMQLTSMEWAGG